MQSAQPTLAALLEASQRLSSSLAQPADLPQIQLGLDQIESQSRRIAGRSAKEAGFVQGDATGNAHYLLAAGGVNASQLSSTIEGVNLVGTFEPLHPLSDTDVEGFLRHTHEQTIISSIEEGRRQTTADFYRNLDTRMRKDWERQKELLFEELGRHQAGPSSESTVDTPRRRAGFDRASVGAPAPSATSSLQMHSKMMKYDRVIRRLNDYRKEGYAFGLVSALGEASAATTNDFKATQVTETWRLLGHIVHERDVLNGEFQRASLTERQYARAYLAEDQDGSDAVALRKMIGEGARMHLEEQFVGYVEKIIASRPADAALGGVPSIQNKIRAFLNVKYYKQGSWTNSSLEVINGEPVWAKIYYLLRSGHTKEALDFATENEQPIHNLERGFVPYLKAWLQSDDRRLPKLLRDRFLSEYNQRIRYAVEASDPYKHALYKLIGRVEISRRNVPGVTNTTEDWLWFQLSLVRETDGPGDAPHERYGLRDLAKVLIKFGPSHFDPDTSRPRPLLYFQVLLLCGLFERAIAFLHQHSQYQTDAVHFAIALEYYGLLRIPSRVKHSDVELLVVTQDGAGYEIAHLQFARLLHRYTRAFASSDPQEALHYLYLICLNADLPSPLGNDQVKLCHDYIRDLVMDTRKYAELLGDVRNDGTKIAGMLERDIKLIHLKDESSYLTGIVQAAARRADQEKRFAEAILLYNLAEQYDSVIRVLNVELGYSLSKPSASSASDRSSYFKSSGETVSMAVGQENIASIARSILDHYDRSSGIGGRVSRKNRETCETLLQLKAAMALYEDNLYDKALAAIESVNIIPLHGDLVTIIRSAEEFKDLDEAIIRNVDVILITTMTILYKLFVSLKESPFGDAGRQQKMTELRQKARSLMMFASSLRYRLPNDTYASLNRIDVHIC